MLYPFVASFNDIPLKSDIYTFCAVNTNLLSDLLKTGLAVITQISEENWSQFFLHIVLRCLANHKNGTVTDILKCILWNFDKKSGYFLLLLSVCMYVCMLVCIYVCIKECMLV